MRKFLALSLCILFLGVYVNQAYACLTSQSTHKIALEESDVVFLGKLIGCVDDEEDSYLKYSTRKVWKGKANEEYKVKVKHPCKHDLFQPQINKKALIYASYIPDTQHLVKFGDHCTARGGVILPVWKDLYYKIASIFTGTYDGPPSLKGDLKALGKPAHTYK